MGVSISSSNPSRGDVKPQRSSTTATSNSVTPDLDDARSDATSDTSMEAREAIRSAIRAVARSKRTNRAAQQAHHHTTTADAGGLHHTTLRARDTQTPKQTITAGSYHSHQKQTSHLQEWLATLNAPVVAAA